MVNNPHDHARPDTADQRAVLAVARVLLTTADPADAAHDYAGSGDCLACTVVAAVQWGFALSATMATAEPFLSERLARAALAAVDAAQRELDTMGN
jgi:hypothetical protein